MPRTKPDRVEVIRFELGNKERQLIEDGLIAYQINKIGTPLVALLSDVSALTFLATSWAVWKYGEDALEYFKNEAYEDVQELGKDLSNIIKALPVIKQGIDFTEWYGSFRESSGSSRATSDAWWANLDPEIVAQMAGRTR